MVRWHECVVCWLPAVDRTYPPLCEGCERRPFSTKASVEHVATTLPIPAESLSPGSVFTSWAPGEEYGERYVGFHLAILGVKFEPPAAAAPPDGAASHSEGRGVAAVQDSSAPVIIDEPVPLLLWRAVVFMRSRTRYLEVTRLAGLKYYEWKVTGVTAEGQPLDDWGEEVELATRGLELVALWHRANAGRPKGTGYFGGPAEFREAVVTIIAHEHAVGRRHGQKEVAEKLNRQFKDGGREGFTGGDQQLRKWIKKYGPPWSQLLRLGHAKAAEFRGY